MDKEEQIKRLAQNLFNSGFTKSMDHAIHTAANMLGFPDSLVTSKKSDLGDSPDEVVTERMSGYSRDMSRRITQSIAQERVYSQVPSSLRPAIQNGFEKTDRVTNEPIKAEAYSESHSEQSDAPKDHFSDTIFVDSRVADQGNTEMQSEQTKGFSDSNYVNQEEDIFTQQSPIDIESNNSQYSVMEEDDVVENYSSQPSIFDEMTTSSESSSGENFLEETPEVSEAVMPEWNEEEQTSLMSGYMDSSEEKSNLFSGENDENNQSMENIFKGDSSRINDMEENSLMHEINSRFDSILGPEEDFFTASLAQKNSQEEDVFSRNEVSESSNNNGFASPIQAQAQVQSAASVSRVSDAPEATVDLSEMFNFRNLKR